MSKQYDKVYIKIPSLLITRNTIRVESLLLNLPKKLFRISNKSPATRQFGMLHHISVLVVPLL